MTAVATVFAILVVAGAAVTVLYPGLRSSSLMLVATTALGALLALSLGSVAVFGAEVIGAAVILLLIQLRPHPDHPRPPGPSLLARVTAGVPAAILLVALAWAALASAWPSGSGTAGQGVGTLLGRDLVVPVAVTVLLVITAALALVSLRAPRERSRR